MVDEAMLDASLDMSLDDLIAKGMKKNTKPERRSAGTGASGGRGGREKGGRRGSRTDKPGKDEAMEVDEPNIKVTIQNTLKPQGGGVAKKKSTSARTLEVRKPAREQTAPANDGKPRPRLDLDSVTWSHDLFKAEGPSKPRVVASARGRSGGVSRTAAGTGRVHEPQGKRTQLNISNLADDVDNNDIQELFQRIGPTKKAEVTYDNTGRPTGRAEVVYQTEGHAQSAFDQYHGVALDGQKMQIKIVTEKVANDGTFRLSSGLEVTGGRRAGANAVVSNPRGRGSAGRLKSSAHAMNID